MRVFIGSLQQIVGKSLFGCFIYCVCFHLLHFVSLLTVYAVECSFVAAVTLTFKGSEPSWHTGPNETVLHFQVVFVIS